MLRLRYHRLGQFDEDSLEPDTATQIQSSSTTQPSGLVSVTDSSSNYSYLIPAAIITAGLLTPQNRPAQPQPGQPGYAQPSFFSTIPPWAWLALGGIVVVGVVASRR